jgi:two-component system chemotaxis response regulator CheY
LTEINIDKITIASNGKEAVQFYNDSDDKADVIIMDYRMPLMNGIDAMIEILKIDNDAKIIFSSADSSVKEQALNSGAVYFLNKPFDVQHLLQTVKSIISKIENVELI